MRRRTAIIAAMSTVMLAGGSAALVFATNSASAASGYDVAPYVDMSANSSGMLTSAISQVGLKSYTAAFVIGSGCNPIWGDSLGIDSSTVNAKIAQAQSQGAKTIIAFGGAAGAELGQSCTDTAALTSAYQSVIDKYKVDHLDFDIEGAAIADPASINRRYQAIKNLQARNSGLNVSVTIPVLSSGPTGDGAAFLAAAKANGARIDMVNIMTMDYGSPVADMGTAAINAAKATFSVAKGVWSDFSYAKLGITPMIGQNDSAGEIFTQANARAVVDFANANGVGRLAFWSIGRDQPCPGGAGGGASPNCSSIAQSNLEFTAIFNGAKGGGGGQPTPTGGVPSPTPTGGGGTGGCTAPAWSASAVYVGGARVSYNGHQYTAKWWTQGEQPDRSTGDGRPWADNGPCTPGGGGGVTPTSAAPTGGNGGGTGQYPAWQANHAYAIGDLVSYGGHNYKCIQAHTSLTGWEPSIVPALWQLLG